MITKRSLVYLLLMMTLIACHRTPESFQYLVENPQTIPSVLESCRTKGANASHDPGCLVAQQAFNQVRNLLLQAQQNGQAFGQIILSIQTTMASNQQQLLTIQDKLDHLSPPENTDNKIKLQQQIAQLQQQSAVLASQYKQHIGIIRLQGI